MNVTPGHYCRECNNEKGQRDKKKIQEWKRTHND